MTLTGELSDAELEAPVDADAEAIFTAWTGKFAAAVAANDPEAIAATFVPDGFWRDIVAFTWDYRTRAGRQQIVEGLAEALPAVTPRHVRRAPDRMAPRATKYLGQPVVEGYLDFDTAVGRGTAYARLLLDEHAPQDSLAWVVLTTLQDLSGHEEQIGALRPTGTEYSWEFGGDNWLDLRTKAVQYADRDPQVLIVGGGQAGLCLAARLTQFGVDALIVERNPRIGDNWRNRYHSLTLHNEVWANSLPYIPFPATWPTFLPKDKLAGWLESYAEFMELNVWTGTELVDASYDEASKRWTARVRRADGTERALVVPHLVFATGGVSGQPKMPQLPGLDEFHGDVMHSSAFSSGISYAGKKAIVVGAGNSGHDVAQDLHANGAAEVTMIQRGPTAVVSLVPSGILVYSLFTTGPVEDIDLITAANPYELLLHSYKWLTKRTCRIDADLIAGLEAAGFKVGFGHDDTGFHMQYLRRGGGYYINVGCSDLIIDGKINVIQHEDIETFTADGLALTDGRRLDADVVVMATGYDNMQEQIRRFCGSEVADKVGPVWGWDDEGWMRNIWRRTPQDGLWVMGGGLHECRTYSKFLANLITADLEGLLPPRAA
ncbi:FAD-dependent oxidoreductase [Sporichthya polymorpha]|uniref:FAD-dependent oxidoreductase n=1 Tax=Sporichthya polymorpha TaxID=35751 RepID=UPI00037DEDFC|nr:FAD-dependent oxidoreductase [Sporichthya polymorpha]